MKKQKSLEVQDKIRSHFHKRVEEIEAALPRINPDSKHFELLMNSRNYYLRRLQHAKC